MSTLSLEEIELQLEENPDDLTVWREWLSYCRRHDLPQDRYIEYLEKEGILKTYKHTWEIFKGKSLDILRRVVTTKTIALQLFNSELESISGLEEFIAPKLEHLVLKQITKVEITAFPKYVWAINSKLVFSDTADFSKLITLHLNKVEIENIDKIYEAENLENLILEDISRPDIQISRFKNLVHLSVDNPDILKKLGTSDTVTSIHAAKNRLTGLVNNGWYPNLEFPIKGINNQ